MGGPVFNRSVEGADNNPTPKGFGVRGVSNTEEGFGVIGLKDTTVRDEAERAGVYGDGGDSAGGNMTCVIALKLRDENGPKLALHVPLFPEAAFPGDTLSGGENRTGLYLETNGIYQMVRNYLKNSDDGRHPYITPMNAESHANLPPTILVTIGFDPLRDVGHAYAQKLAAAGNDLTYVYNADLTREFRQFTRYSAACHKATMELADLIKAHIG